MRVRFLCSLAALALLTSPALAANPNQLGEGMATAPTSGYSMPVAPDGECDCIDIAFVIDDTGSMGGAINNVKAEIANLLALAEATCSSVQAGLVTFKDQTNVVHDLNFDTAGVAAAIGGLFASGGAGEPECSDDALREISDDATCFGGSIGAFTVGNWRPVCCKVAILVTDARPAGQDCDDFYDGLGSDGADAIAAATACADLGVRVGAVFVPTFGDPGDIVTIMTSEAAVSGGIFAQVGSTGLGTADAMEQMILDCSGAAETELCCLTDGTCVEVLAGQCEGLGGTVVMDCEACNATAVENTSWGSVKTLYGE